MNCLFVRICFFLLVWSVLFAFQKINAQTIHYQLVDLDPDTREETPANFLDSLGPFSQPTKIFMEGLHVYSHDKRFSFGNSGFWSTAPVYNFVDGLWLGQTFESKMHFSDKHKLELESMIYYTTARKKITWQSDLVYMYLPHLVGKLKLSGGDISADYDTEEHLARLENSLYSLILGRNYMKLYRKRFVELKNSFYPLPGFRLYNSFSVQWRSMEVNRTTYSFIKPEDNFDQSNIPENKYFEPMPLNLALIGSIGFDFTLCKACVYSAKSNEIIYSFIPTLSARTVFGLPTGNSTSSHFMFIEGSLNQRFKFTEHNTFDYRIGGGSFLFKHNLWFPDFRHFGAYTLPSMRTFSDDGYFLIGYYKADTQKSWVKASANYMSERFLLTRIKCFDNNDFSEGVHFRYLWTPQIRHYTEYGYAFGYKDLIRIGGFVGFTGVRYTNFGFTISFPWLTGGY